MNPPEGLLQTWSHTAPTASRTLVLPDGCCDLIVHMATGQPPQWQVSVLADTSYAVASAPGDYFRGYRLQPGAQIDQLTLLRAIGEHAAFNNQSFDDADVMCLLDAWVRVDARVTEALAALEEAPTIAQAVRRLGVSERTLERLLMTASGRSPGYWRGLARVRRAARALSTREPLAAIAADHGYSDQAHFSRDCTRWLGMSPGQLRTAPNVLAVLSESGYG